MLVRVLLFLFVVGGSLLGALATAFSGDAGPGIAFYVLSICTLLFLISGLLLTFSRQPFGSSVTGKFAMYVFVGVIGFLAIAAVALRLYTRLHNPHAQSVAHSSGYSWSGAREL